MPEETLYERLTPAAFETRIRTAPIAYLPLGTLEWHGPHLPLGSDHLQIQGFFTQLAQRAGGVVLPPLFLGPDEMKTVNGAQYYGMEILQKTYPHPVRLSGSAYWVPEKLFGDILDGIFVQLRRAGIRVVVAHGHGPSTSYIVKKREALEKRHDLRIMTLWRNGESLDRTLEFQSDHAAANETSVMMALHPTLVHMENLPADLSEPLLATMGKDPRTYASPAYGLKIIATNLDRMEALLRQQLAQIAVEDATRVNSRATTSSGMTTAMQDLPHNECLRACGQGRPCFLVSPRSRGFGSATSLASSSYGS